jgi:non-heme chloroperoxidase
MNKHAVTHHRSFGVTTPDDVTLSAQEWGYPDGPEILFIHGFSQASLSWKLQVTSELANEFKMVTYDMRGHGNSDKPLERDKYQEEVNWANEVRAVMTASRLKRPIIVGWSFGGRVISDYLKYYGDDDLAGLVYVNAVSKSDPRFFGDAPSAARDMCSADLGTNISGSRAFLRSCFASQPAQEEFEEMLAFTMMVPPAVRSNMIGRTTNIDEILKTLSIPALVVHGEEDTHTLAAMARHTAETIPDARLSIYKGVGHSPFFEAPQKFNMELADFVRTAYSTAKPNM